ncbi:hypothetical protein [Rubripirellula lacrimiformis]|nr:hypothetical protein [Rubripirellula lacrimiformis]
MESDIMFLDGRLPISQRRQWIVDFKTPDFADRIHRMIHHRPQAAQKY